MKEQTVFHRILLKILKKLGLIKEFEIDKSEMCKKPLIPEFALNLAKFAHGTSKQNRKRWWIEWIG